MTPRVALARDSTRLACRSPSNRTLRKWLTCRKPRVRSGFIDRPANRVACREIRGSRARGNRFMSSGRLRIQPGRCDSFQKATAPRLILLLPEEFKLEMRGCMRRHAPRTLVRAANLASLIASTTAKSLLGSSITLIGNEETIPQGTESLDQQQI